MKHRDEIIKILEAIKKDSFKNADEVTDEDAMGILMARYFGNSGLSILKAAYSALEDSNFHAVNRQIDSLIKQVGGE